MEGDPTTIVIGCGGSGCNIAERLSVLSEIDIVTVNTDSKGLTRSRSGERILLGDDNGCNGNVKKGIRAAKKAKRMISETIADHSQIILTAGLGGGTGTGAVQAIAKFVKDKNVISVVTLPMMFEADRRKAAISSLQNICRYSDTTIILDGSCIAEADHSLNMNEAMAVLNELVCESIMRTVMVQEDPRIRSFLNGKIFTTALAEATEPLDALEAAVNNPMMPSYLFSNERTIIHMDGILRANDPRDIANAYSLISNDPIIVTTRSSAKKISIMLFIPLSCVQLS